MKTPLLYGPAAAIFIAFAGGFGILAIPLALGGEIAFAALSGIATGLSLGMAHTMRASPLDIARAAGREP